MTPIFPRKKSQQECRKLSFNDMMHPRKVAPPQFLPCFLIFISQKVAAYVLKGMPGSSLSSIQFIFEVLALKKLPYLRTDKNAFSYLGLTSAWKFSP
jgi:hypothetical protein